MSNFFAKLTGFDPKYAEQNIPKKTDETNDDFDYSDVDFCQGNIETTFADEGIFAMKYDTEFKYEEFNDDDSSFNTEG